MQKMDSQQQASSQPGASLWPDCAWGLLLDSIKRRDVIPIIGPDLLQVEVNGKSMSFDRYVAIQLAAKYSLPVDQTNDQLSLNRVVCELLRNSRMPKPYGEVFDILEGASFKPPQALRQLAQIC